MRELCRRSSFSTCRLLRLRGEHNVAGPSLELTVCRTFAVNTLSHFWTLKAFLPGMIKQKAGHIVSYFDILAIAD